MGILQQILFLALTGVSVWLFSKNAGEIKRNIFLGLPEDLSDNPSARWKNLFLLALGQKKMFKNPLVALMHLVVYGGFIIINLEVLEIVLDGLLGTHRLFVPYIGFLYIWLLNAFEFLAVLVIIVCATFLIRRNIIKLKRFASKDLDGWPRSDANYILFTEIVLMSLFLTMNACDLTLQSHGSEHYHQTGIFFFSGLISPLFSGLGDGTLVAIERTCWWLHIIGIFAFLNYLPYSKHLHILLAFPNA